VTDDIRDLEERALNAWPALQTVVIGGWLVRFSEGYTKRANSACTLGSPAAPLSEVGAAIEAMYERHGQKPIFRLSALARDDDAEWLAKRGYGVLEPTAIMTKSLGAAIPVDPDVVMTDAPSEAWLAGFSEGNRYGPAVRPTLEKMLAAIRPQALFATLNDDGRACGYGLAVVERGRVGLFDILVEERVRGRGLGRRLVQAMLGAGARAGAKGAYLQVLEANEVAIGLYGSLGFAKRYGYAYQVR
jgi:ribosomal protein S18 acetylase RimI-like enzyme